MRFVNCLSLMAIGVIAVASAGAFAQSDKAVVERLPAALKEQRFLTCRETARPVGKEGFLGVCERHDHDEGIMYSSVPYVTTIIYDSTDQIALESPRRSSSWKAVALSLDKQAPFGILGFHVKNLGGHYYSVTFDAQYPAKL